jgi:hypothetical protein
MKKNTEHQGQESYRFTGAQYVVHGMSGTAQKFPRIEQSSLDVNAEY